VIRKKPVPHLVRDGLLVFAWLENAKRLRGDHAQTNLAGSTQSLLVESQSEQSSDPRAGANIHGKSVQEILQRILSGEQSRAMGAKASLPYSNPHGIPLAAYFPTPGILAASASENRDIK
jgi:hypothetical protein